MTTDTATKIEVNTKIKEPSLYKVVYMNDDKTTVDFVIESLVEVFDHTKESALAITEEVHRTGSGVAAILPYEIAEQKGIEVTQAARKNNFPLLIKLETA